MQIIEAVCGKNVEIFPLSEVIVFVLTVVLER